jgi:hypothetical protein
MTDLSIQARRDTMRPDRNGNRAADRIIELVHTDNATNLNA